MSMPCKHCGGRTRITGTKRRPLPNVIPQVVGTYRYYTCETPGCGMFRTWELPDELAEKALAAHSRAARPQPTTPSQGPSLDEQLAALLPNDAPLAVPSNPFMLHNVAPQLPQGVTALTYEQKRELWENWDGYGSAPEGYYDEGGPGYEDEPFADQSIGAGNASIKDERNTD